MPFGCVVVVKNEVLIKSENMAIRSNDVTAHAEMVVMRNAQKLLGKANLPICDIYCSREPCAMCSLMIRELGFKKVVFSLYSQAEGGYSKYKILQDPELNIHSHHFGPIPEIVHGILQDRAQTIWDIRESEKKSIRK